MNVKMFSWVVAVVAVLFLISACTHNSADNITNGSVSTSAGASQNGGVGSTPAQNSSNGPVKPNDTIPKNSQDTYNPEAFGSPEQKVQLQNVPPCCNHPYYHSVYEAGSSDGISFSSGSQILNHASVPDAFALYGKTILYYVNGSIDNLDCSVINSSGSISYGNCTIYGMQVQKAWDPSIVNLGNGTYRLYFFAPQAVPEPKHAIFSALSDDGINFVMDKGIRFSYGGIMDPSVLKEGSVYRMYSWYMGQNPGDDTIVVSQSSDGLSFSETEELHLGGGVPDIAKLSDGSYALYYCRNGGIDVMTSADGLSFSNERVAIPAPNSGIACDPSVISNGSGYTMFYKVQKVS